MIKIAIDGIHGSGKTTLVNNIKNYLESINKNVYLVGEVARKYPYKLGTIRAQRWIWEAHINEELKGYNSNCDVILCDRTLLSNLIYYKYIIKDQPINSDSVFDAFLNYTRQWMKTYTHISILDMNSEFIVDDGFRITDIDKTIEINNLFIKYLKPYQSINIINRFNYKEKIEKILNDNYNRLY